MLPKTLLLVALAGSVLAHPQKCHPAAVTTLTAVPVSTTAVGESDSTVVVPVETATTADQAYTTVTAATTTSTSTKATTTSAATTSSKATTTSAATTSSKATTTSSSAPTSVTSVPNADGSCGATGKGAKCAAGECCSKWGYCGTTADFCAAGCQSAFGFCSPVQPTTPPPPPTGNLPDRKAVAPQVISQCVVPGDAALTFDDGPGEFTEELLAILKKNNIHSTFFMNGNNYKCIFDDDAKQTIKDVAAAGHQIAAHTWSHPYDKSWKPFDTLNPEETYYQFRKLEDAFMRVLGKTPTYFRGPQGLHSDAQVKQIAKLGYKIIDWSVDPGDANGETIASQKKTETEAFTTDKQTHPIILHHDVHQSTVETMVVWITTQPWFKNFRWVTVAQCLGDTGDLYMKVPTLTGKFASDTCVDGDRFLSMPLGL